jgi:putative sterol carrier protein
MRPTRRGEAALERGKGVAMASLEDITDTLRRALEAEPTWTRSVKLDFKDGSFVLIDGQVISNADGPAECTLRVSREDFIALARGRLDPASAMMRGRLKIVGDVSLAMGLQPLLSKARAATDHD